MTSLAQDSLLKSLTLRKLQTNSLHFSPLGQFYRSLAFPWFLLVINLHWVDLVLITERLHRPRTQAHHSRMQTHRDGFGACLRLWGLQEYPLLDHEIVLDHHG